MPSALREHQSVLDAPHFVAFLEATYWVVMAYEVLAAVMIWRNAYNVANRIWGHLARLIVVLGLILLIGGQLNA